MNLIDIDQPCEPPPPHCVFVIKQEDDAAVNSLTLISLSLGPPAISAMENQCVRMHEHGSDKQTFDSYVCAFTD